MFAYSLTGLVTLLCLFVLFWVTAKVGVARGKHGVKVPEMTGPEPFVWAVRVHLNTIEGLILFLPALWLFALTVSDVVAASVGIFYPIGRILYALGYYKEPSKREIGFSIGLLATVVCLLGSAYGLFLSLTA
jgi:glutathione S-transferase